jgi:hypothetical protein
MMMNDDIEAKINLITRMITSLGKLTNIEARLRWSGDIAAADEIKAKHDELREQIDILRGRVADQWTKDAAQVEEGIRKANTKVQASIRDIKKKIKIAENVVKVIGQVNDAVVAVRELYPV